MTLYECLATIGCVAVAFSSFFFVASLENKRLKRYYDLLERFVSAHEALAGRK